MKLFCDRDECAVLCEVCGLGEGVVVVFVVVWCGYEVIVLFVC